MTMQADAASDGTYDFNCWNAANEIWNGTAFVAEVVADYLLHRIATTTKSTDASDPAILATYSAADIAGATYFTLRVRGATLALSYEVVARTSTDAADAAAIQGNVVSAIKADPVLGIDGMVAKTNLIGTIRSLVRW